MTLSRGLRENVQPAENRYRMDDYYLVGREKIREFAKALGDFHPVHWDDAIAGEFGFTGLVAPLTFFSIIGIMAQRGFFTTVACDYDLSQLLHVEQTLNFHRPLVAGDRLRTEVILDSIRPTPGGQLITTTTEFVDSRHDLVLLAGTTVLGRGKTALDPELARLVADVGMQGAPPAPEAVESAARAARRVRASAAEASGYADPDRWRPRTGMSFEDIAVGDPLPAETVLVTRGDLVNYAGVAGDANPIHWSDHIAAAAGLPGVVAQGMFTMGLGARYITSWAGDPAAVRSYRVRFSGMAIVDPARAATVEFTGRVKSLDSATRTMIVVLVAKAQGRRIFGRAEAKVQLR